MAPQQITQRVIGLADRPGLLWRLSSAAIMGLTGALSKGFLYGFNNVQTTGLENFLQFLRERQAGGRRKGLITVCNHISVLDDPLIWGVLPLRYGFDPRNHRWSLGAHDICFKNGLSSLFFSLGQVLPTHRMQHSPHGGLFQPTMSQAVRILSGPGNGLESTDDRPALDRASGAGPSRSVSFSTTGRDSFFAPAAYSENRGSWIHVFPEGCVHQHPENALRYFKWGVSRLILESNPTPDIIPMFIDGTQRIMPEDRKWPRFLPRIGVKVHVTFGDPIDVGRVFGAPIRRWKSLGVSTHGPPGDKWRDGEASAIRIEVAKLMRDEMVKLRRSLGYAGEDEYLGLAETWAREPKKDRFTSPVDGSVVRKH